MTYTKDIQEEIGYRKCYGKTYELDEVIFANMTLEEVLDLESELLGEFDE